MQKTVLISTQPKWCADITSGKKTIEVRKTKPKLETPFKVYIYVTKAKRKDDFMTKSEAFGYITCPECAIYNRAKEYDANGKVIGEFVCDRIDEYGAEFTDLQYPDACDKNVCLNSIKQVEYDEEEDGPVYRYVTSNEEENPDDCKFLKESCLTFNDVRKYIGETCYDKHFYAWHISDLKIYDKPKELSEFLIDCKNCGKKFVGDPNCWQGCVNGYRRLKRPPQSWCYVEELQNVSR